MELRFHMGLGGGVSMDKHDRSVSKHIKPLCSPNPNKNNDKTKQDSKTVDVMRLGGRRSRVTVRIKPELKEALKRFCSASGTSICHITEALYTAYLVGVNQKISLDAKSPTINLTLVRDVKRVRRYGREYEPETNFYDGKEGLWKFVSDAELNENGHAIGCACKICGR